MTRGISDPAPIQEEAQPQQSQDDQPSNSDILAYLDDLSDFVREMDIRLSTIEKFAIKEIGPEKPKSKNFFTGK